MRPSNTDNWCRRKKFERERNKRLYKERRARGGCGNSGKRERGETIKEKEVVSVVKVFLSGIIFIFYM